MTSPDFLPEVLSSRIIVSHTGHWLWTGFDENGYGKHTYKKRTWRVHRLVWVLSGRTLTPGLELDHRCRVTICCNPNHCEEVPKLENLRRQREDMEQARNNLKRLSQTQCVNGHVYTPETVAIRNKKRHCLVCQRAATRRYRERKAEIT